MRPYSRWPWLLVLVLIIVVVWIWWWCPTWSKATIVLQDSHAAVWAPIDNAYTVPYNHTGWANKRDGVIFQFGDFWRYKTVRNDDGSWGETKKLPLIGFNKITIAGSGGATVELGKDDFTWIDVIGNDPKFANPPITREEADRLYPNNRVQTLCDVVDNCTRVIPPPSPWTCANDLTTIPDPCLRLRSLHGFFTPFAIMTYWRGERGFRAVSDPAKQQPGRHAPVVFELKDIVAVTVWNGMNKAAKDTDVQNLGTIKTITIHEPLELNHGEAHDPPMTFYNSGGSWTFP